MEAVKTLNASERQPVSYCIPLWLRDEQIKLAIARVSDRVQPHPLRDDRIAIVCYGPSLNETWQELRNFRYIMTCSGAHKFLVERGITPTWHVEVDPRAHKVALIGPPQRDTEYLIASTCHPAVFDHLDGFTVKLWHVFDTKEDGLRTLPAGEWALTGGCGAGLRAMLIARFLGFTEQHVFGMDGNQRDDVGKHASEHPSQAQKFFTTDYDGVTYKTTPAFLEAARQTFSELDKLSDVDAKFYGEGLVQHMARNYVRRPVPANIAYVKPELISPEYRELNMKLHADALGYGVGGGNHTKAVLSLAASLKTTTVLDYGCGKGYLAKELPFPIWEYDPAIPGKQASPRPADLVVCTDVLEHIEPELLFYVLGDIQRCVKRVGYLVINTAPAAKSYANGRNTHLIQRDADWWRKQLAKFFTIGETWVKGPKVHVVVAPNVKVSAGPLSFGQLTFFREPYPVGVVSNILDEGAYRALSDDFPSLELFKHISGGDDKYSLSERHNPEQYHAFLQGSPMWKEFHGYVKSPAFVEKIRRVLRAHKFSLPDGALTSRFEFSVLKQNGVLRPHRDLESKVVTLVIGMGPATSGSTDILLDRGINYRAKPLVDYQAPLELFNVVHAIPHLPNQGVLFMRSERSWHTVGPMLTDEERRTITVNIETT